MRQSYIEMRQSGQLHMEWFYAYYEQEFENIPTKYLSFVKDMHGNLLLEEIPGMPGSFRYLAKEKDAEKITREQFAQAFGLSMTMYANDILEFLDKKFTVTKVEDKEGKVIHIS